MSYQQHGWDIHALYAGGTDGVAGLRHVSQVTGTVRERRGTTGEQAVRCLAIIDVGLGSMRLNAASRWPEG